MTEDEVDVYLDEVMVEVTRDMIQHLNNVLVVSLLGVFWCSLWLGISVTGLVNTHEHFWAWSALGNIVLGTFFFIRLGYDIPEWNEERAEIRRLKEKGTWTK